MKVVTKWRRVCSPSVTMSMPACSWSRSTSRTASRLPSASASPSSSQGAQSCRGGHSQAGFGRLPAIVVCRERFIGVLGGGGRARRVVDHDYIGALPGAGALGTAPKALRAAPFRARLTWIDFAA